MYSILLCSCLSYVETLGHFWHFLSTETQSTLKICICQTLINILHTILTLKCRCFFFTYLFWAQTNIKLTDKTCWWINSATARTIWFTKNKQPRNAKNLMWCHLLHMTQTEWQVRGSVWCSVSCCWDPLCEANSLCYFGCKHSLQLVSDLSKRCWSYFFHFSSSESLLMCEFFFCGLDPLAWSARDNVLEKTSE